MIGFGVVSGLDVADVKLIAVAIGTWVIALLCLGMALGAFARSHSELAIYYDLGGLTLTVLGGALVPLTTMPGWARALSPVSPGYWPMDGARSALGGDAAGMLFRRLCCSGRPSSPGSLASWRITCGLGRSHRL